MRDIIKTIATGAIATLAFASCDFYDLESVQPVDAVDFDLAIIDAASARTARAGIYNQLQLDNTFDGYLASWQYFSDEADWSGTFPTREEFDIYSVFPANNTLGGFFADFYEIINTANLYLEAVDAAPSEGFPDDLKNSLRGEARFARALAYFHLTQGWTDVPLVTVGTRAVSDDLFVSASPRSAILDLIEEDLTFAAANIKNGESLGITAEAAAGIHARVALIRGNWAQAQSLATGVLGDGFDLTAFPYLSDVVYQIEFSSTDGNALAFFWAPSTLNGRYSIHPSDNLIDAYEDGDLRRNSSIDTLADGTPYGIKYDNFNASAGAQDDPILVLRHSELVLIAAEAAARQDNFDEAEDFLNQVRQRAGLDDIEDLDDDNLDDIILQERFVELAMEGGHRIWDVRRLGKAEELFGGAGYDSCDDRWPFPQFEIDRNPNLDQNTACNG